MAVELAQAYISLTVRTDGVAREINQALNSSSTQVAADRAGATIGSRMSSGIGSALKLGGAALGLAAGAVIGTALNKGFQRVVAIDDAQGKLAGLGHTADGVATIMDSALKSVKGTAFGLGDAATIAASAVAAGVKPGEELTKYLSLTADAATIAGSSLGEMGAILNKVQTSGKVYTDNLNMLADRGIPIFQWLQEEYGVTSEQLSKMVKDGKVDAETFKKVIEDNIGGAALESGKTLRGSFANMQAALGRIGAGAITPFLPMMKSALGGLTAWADKVTPVVQEKAEKLASNLKDMGAAFMTSGASVEGSATNFEKFGIKARYVADGLSGVWSILKDGQYLGSEKMFGLSEDSGFVRALQKIHESMSALWAVVRSPDGEKFREFVDTLRTAGDESGESMSRIESGAKTIGGALQKLGAAAAAGGVALASLGGDTATLAVHLLGELGDVVGYLADHTGVATAGLAGLAAAFAIAQTAQTGFHMARIAAAIMTPAEIASRMAMTRAIIDQTAVQRAYLAALGAEVPAQQATFRERMAATIARQRETIATAAQSTALGRLAAAQAAAAASATPIAGALRNTAAAAMNAGARIQGLASVAMGSLRSAAGSVSTMFGGPLGLAITGVTIGMLGLYAHQQKVAERNREITQTAQDLGKALYESNGAITEAGQKAAATALEQLKLAGSGRSMIEYLEAIGVSGKTASLGLAGSRTEMQLTMKALEEQAAAEKALNQERIRGEGFGSTGLGQLLNWGGARDKNNEAQNALETVQKLSEETVKAAESRRRLQEAGRLDESGTATALGTMGEAMARFAESTGGAADKVSILNGGLAALRGDQMSIEKAQQSVNDALRSFSEAMQDGGTAAVGSSGQIDTATAAGSRLFDAMERVQTAFDNAGTAAYQSALQQGQSQADAALAAEAAAQVVRDRFIEQQTAILGSRDAAVALADQYGLFPKEIRTNLLLTGTAEAEAALRAIEQKERTARIKVAVEQYGPGSIEAWAAATNGQVVRRASGGSVNGAGGPTSDSIPALLSDGEHVLTAAEVNAAGGQGAIYKMRGMIRSGLLRFAEGGAVGNGIQRALTAGRSVTGNKYDWGGTGPLNFDCSGFVGWLQQIVMGIEGSVKRLYTTYDFFGAGSNGYAGLLPGLGPAGTQFQVGVSQEHMAATIAGQPAESGGSHGDSRIGAPAVGATDPQFTKHFYLPNSMIAGGVGSYGGSRGGKPKDAPEWTESDQLDLDSAHLSVQEARENRAKMNAADSKATDTDRQQADIAIRRAELRVIELQGKKDEALSYVPEGPAPEAPALAEAYDKEERERIRAQIAVDDARLDRNEVYADPYATDNDRKEADLTLMEAQEKLDELTSGKSDSSEEKLDYSLRGTMKRFGGRLVDAVIDGFFGQLPGDLADSRWLTTDWGSLIPEEVDGKGSGWLKDPKDPLGNLVTPSKDKVDKQLPVTPGEDGWIESLLNTSDPATLERIGVLKKHPVVAAVLAARDDAVAPKDFAEELDWKKRKKAPKVYDQGGWLGPGEMAINLSDRPEPIFNSPDQLRRFAGQLQPAEQSQSIDARIIFQREVNVNDMEEFKRTLRFESNRQSAPYRRR